MSAPTAAVHAALACSLEAMTLAVAALAHEAEATPAATPRARAAQVPTAIQQAPATTVTGGQCFDTAVRLLQAHSRGCAARRLLASARLAATRVTAATRRFSAAGRAQRLREPDWLVEAARQLEAVAAAPPALGAVASPTLGPRARTGSLGLPALNSGASPALGSATSSTALGSAPTRAPSFAPAAAVSTATELRSATLLAHRLVKLHHAPHPVIRRTGGRHSNTTNELTALPTALDAPIRAVHAPAHGGVTLADIADGSALSAAAAPPALAGSGGLALLGSTSPLADGSVPDAAAAPRALAGSGGLASRGSASPLANGSALAAAAAPLTLTDDGGLASRGSVSPLADGSALAAAAAPLALEGNGGLASLGSAPPLADGSVLAAVAAPLALAGNGDPASLSSVSPLVVGSVLTAAAAPLALPGGGGLASLGSATPLVADLVASAPLASTGSGDLALLGSASPLADGSLLVSVHWPDCPTVLGPYLSGSPDLASVVVQRRWRALCSRRNEEYESCMRTIQDDLDPSACDIQRAFRSYLLARADRRAACSAVLALAVAGTCARTGDAIAAVAGSSDLLCLILRHLRQRNATCPPAARCPTIPFGALSPPVRCTGGR